MALRLRALGVLHLAPVGLEFPHEERLQGGDDLAVERALLVRLHVGQVVPAADREAGIVVVRVLREPATPEALDVLALGHDAAPIGALEIAPRARAQLAPRDADHHGRSSPRASSRSRTKSIRSGAAGRLMRAGPPSPASRAFSG